MDIQDFLNNRQKLADEFSSEFCVINGAFTPLSEVEKMGYDEFSFRSKMNMPLKLYKYFPSVKRNHAGFERDVNPIDLLKPLIVRTPIDNPRILKQDGAFIICGLDYDEKDSNHKIKRFVQKEIVIPSDKKKLLLSELESVCITEATLFPELEKVSNYLKNRNV